MEHYYQHHDDGYKVDEACLHTGRSDSNSDMIMEVEVDFSRAIDSVNQHHDGILLPGSLDRLGSMKRMMMAGSTHCGNEDDGQGHTARTSMTGMSSEFTPCSYPDNNTNNYHQNGTFCASAATSNYQGPLSNHDNDNDDDDASWSSMGSDEVNGAVPMKLYGNHDESYQEEEGTDIFWRRMSSTKKAPNHNVKVDCYEPLPLITNEQPEEVPTMAVSEPPIEPLPFLQQIQQWHQPPAEAAVTMATEEVVTPVEQPHFDVAWTRTRNFFDAYMISNGGYPIGEGGFGTVYSCVAKQQQPTGNNKGKALHQKKHNNATAVKIIPTGQFNRNEIDILQQLNDCPYIVTLQDIFFGFDRVHLVMEEMKCDLLTRLNEKVYYPENEAREVVATLLQAVQFLHSRGVAHRDIKPENILLDGADHVKLADFGLAKRFRDDQGNRLEHPNMFTLCGSVWYAAPEVFGRPEAQIDCQPYDERCDIWSIGIITYLLLAGYMPFLEARNDFEVVQEVCRGKYKFHSHYWGDVSPAAKDLISSLLKVHPVQRCSLSEALGSAWISPVIRHSTAQATTEHSNIISWTRDPVVLR